MLSFLLHISPKPNAERLLYRSCPCLRPNHSSSQFHMVGNKVLDKWPQTTPSGGGCCLRPSSDFFVCSVRNSTEHVGPFCRVVAAVWTRREEMLFASQDCERY